MDLENAEEILQILERYTRQKQKTIPQELNGYLNYVALTGDPVYGWSKVQYFFREKLSTVIKDFSESDPYYEEPASRNVDAFNYENQRTALLERFDLFHSAPFTIQRLCELLNEPKKHYCRLDKFMRALEKNILVVSTVEPGQRRVDSENGGDSINGDVNVEEKSNAKESTATTSNNKSDNCTYGAAEPPGKEEDALPLDALVEAEIGDELLDLPAVVVEEAKIDDDKEETIEDVAAVAEKDEVKLIDVEGNAEMSDSESIDETNTIEDKKTDTLTTTTAPTTTTEQESINDSELNVEESAAAVEQPIVEEAASDNKIEDKEMITSEPTIDTAVSSATENPNDIVDTSFEDIATDSVSEETSPNIDDETEVKDRLKAARREEEEDDLDVDIMPRSPKIPRLDPLPTDEIVEEKEKVANAEKDEEKVDEVTENKEASVTTEEVIKTNEKTIETKDDSTTNLPNDEKATVSVSPIAEIPVETTEPETLPIEAIVPELPTVESSVTPTIDEIITEPAETIAEPVAEKSEEENAEKMSVEESNGDSSTTPTATPIISGPIVEPIESSVMEESTVIQPELPPPETKAAAEDEKMEVDETNSVDSMDL